MRAGKREEPGASIAPAMEGAPQADEGAKDYQHKGDEEDKEVSSRGSV